MSKRPKRVLKTGHSVVLAVYCNEDEDFVSGAYLTVTEEFQNKVRTAEAYVHQLTLAFRHYVNFTVEGDDLQIVKTPGLKTTCNIQVVDKIPEGLVVLNDQLFYSHLQFKTRGVSWEFGLEDSSAEFETVTIPYDVIFYGTFPK